MLGVNIFGKNGYFGKHMFIDKFENVFNYFCDMFGFKI